MSTSTQISESLNRESRKRVCTNGEDYISHLPESVISHILSRLHTRDAVRTSVLSKDWEYKWTCIYNMNIDDQEFYSRGTDGKISFVDFVERILLLSQNIKVFRLNCCYKYNLRSRMATWISEVLRRNIESFELSYNGEPEIVLPRSLLNNSSLRKLKLDLPCTFKVPSKNYFPNLTTLHLSHVEIRKEVSNKDTLTLIFPLLESCELRCCKWVNVMFVEIFSPALTSFSCETDDQDIQVLDYSIKIFGHKLVNFESSGGSAENFIMTRPPVVKAVLYHEQPDDDSELIGEYGLQFRRLLREFSSLEELEITHWVALAIAHTKQGLTLPRYDKLRSLFLDIGTNIEGLLEILHSAPSLAILGLHVFYISDDYDFDAVESVPSCILSHLEDVELQFYDSYAAATNLAAFLLKHGAKLKEFRIFLYEHSSKDEVMEEVSTFPRASTCVSIVVE